MPWAANVSPVSTSSAAVVGTTGLSQAFGSNVTAGDVIAAASLWIGTASTFTPTFSDTSSNVTSWNTAGNSFYGSALNQNVAVSWGVATASAACTPKVTWNDSASGVMELYCGDFTAPAGSIGQDGSTTTDAHASNVTNIVTPAGGGAGSNDLLVNMMGFEQSFTTFGGGWVFMGNTTPGDACGYLLNAAGNATPNANQSPTGRFVGLVVALKATAAAAVPFGKSYLPLMTSQGRTF